MSQPRHRLDVPEARVVPLHPPLINLRNIDFDAVAPRRRATADVSPPPPSPAPESPLETSGELHLAHS